MGRSHARLLILLGVALLVVLALGRAVVSLYTDALWFSSLNQLSIFLTRLWLLVSVRLVAGAVGASVVVLNLWLVARHLGPVHLRRRYGNIEIAEQVPRVYLVSGIIATAVLAGWWLSDLRFDESASLAVFAWLRQASWGIRDPLFGNDLSFYVFSLPVYSAFADFLLLVLIWTLMLVFLGYVLVGAVRMRENKLEIDEGARFHFTLLIAAIVALLGARYWLGRYGLLLDGNGFGGAIGYTDVTARLPARAIMTVLCIIASAGLVYGALRRLWAPAAVALGVLLVGAVLLGQAYPALIQKLRVEPNQLQREAPYIAWNMEYTRRAYGLDKMQRVSVGYRRQAMPSWEAVGPVLANLPLWDTDPLRTAYNQIQTIFGYYQFPHVDFDRYGPPGNQTQVAIAVREFYLPNLPEASRNWVTLKLNPKYTRGLGAVVSPANRATVDGEPVMWVRDLPRVVRDPAAPPELDLRDPRTYFGETTTDYVMVQPGSDTVDVGSSVLPLGVELNSFTRLVAYAWLFADKNLLFSGELSPESRILYRRTLAERLNALAPFLLWDPDPYPVIDNGRIVWIVDGYSAVRSFPLTRGVRLGTLGAVRYLRNSAKATIDAVTGEVKLYVVDESEPVLRTYSGIFPGLFVPLSGMPASLRSHLRYPPLYLEAQSDILEEYHLDRPEAFYSGQDVWQIPQEIGAPGAQRPYRPTFVSLRLPGEANAEFLLNMPFIARQRQNMTAVLFGRSDAPHYGELMLLELPRDQQIPGPTQVQALMEQDPLISPQLSLWRQAGSDVEIGHPRVIPLDSTFIYVQPLFLSAAGRPIPELQRVIVSDGRAVSMAASLTEAVRGLSTSVSAASPAPDANPSRPAASTPPGTPQDPQRRALELLDDAERRLRSGDFAGFGARLAELRQLLQRSARQ